MICDLNVWLTEKNESLVSECLKRTSSSPVKYTKIQMVSIVV